MTSAIRPIPSDGIDARWRTWDGDHGEELTLRWDNEAWTASGVVSRERVQYVIRLSPTWQVRQFLLFRDLDQPDLWLHTDGQGRWAEMNGARRPELDGCHDVVLACTPFTHTPIVRRSSLDVGEHARVAVVAVDVDTLAVVPVLRELVRVDERSWRHRDDTGVDRSFEVDEHGLVIDEPGYYRRA